MTEYRGQRRKSALHLKLCSLFADTYVTKRLWLAARTMTGDSRIAKYAVTMRLYLFFAPPTGTESNKNLLFIIDYCLFFPPLETL